MSIKDQQCHCSVKIDNLSVKKGDNIILNNITLSANHGEILALIGRNGAGKTTLLKAIMNRISYIGTVEFFNSKGAKITNPRIGYVPQRLSFDRSTPVTVEDMFCANSSRFPIWIGHKKSRIETAKKILRKVGADTNLKKNIGQLSGGELQRVLLAFALDPMPDILLLDEPVSAVDRKGISIFYELVTSLRSEYHMPIILVSHDLGHVSRYATKAALIDHTIVEIGKVDRMMRSPRVRETFGLDIDGSAI